MDLFEKLKNNKLKSVRLKFCPRRETHYVYTDLFVCPPTGTPPGRSLCIYFLSLGRILYADMFLGGPHAKGKQVSVYSLAP